MQPVGRLAGRLFRFFEKGFGWDQVIDWPVWYTDMMAVMLGIVHQHEKEQLEEAKQKAARKTHGRRGHRTAANP